MGRYWWTVWIKVAVFAAALIILYVYVSSEVKEELKPYRLKEAAIEEIQLRRAEEAEKTSSEGEEAEDEDTEEKDAGQGATDALKKIVEDVESKVGIYINYEDFIFDYANDYAQRMMEESKEERNIITQPLS